MKLNYWKVKINLKNKIKITKHKLQYIGMIKFDHLNYYIKLSIG